MQVKRITLVLILAVAVTLIALPSMLSSQVRLSRDSHNRSYITLFESHTLGSVLAATGDTIKSDTAKLQGAATVIIRYEIFRTDVSNTLDSLYLTVIEQQPRSAAINVDIFDTLSSRLVDAAGVYYDTIYPHDSLVFACYIEARLASDALRDSSWLFSIDMLKFAK